MDVVIFCGGRGTRLMEKTSTMPKPLVNIGDQPILWHIMKIYTHYGYSKFILPLGYLGDEIKKWFLYYSWFSSEKFSFNVNSPTPQKMAEEWNIHFKNTGVETGTAMRLYRIKDLIKTDQFHVTYGDGVSDIDLFKVIEYHNNMKKKHNIIATISAVRPYSKYGIIDADEKGIIKSFREKPQMEDYVNIGFMIFEKNIFNYFEDIKEGDMVVHALLPKLAKEGKLAIYKHEGFFSGMDSYKDYKVLNKIWDDKKKWKVWD